VLNYPCCSELFNHRARTGVFLGPRTKNLLAFSYVRRLHLNSRQPYRHALHWRHQQLLLSGFGGRKAPSSMDKLSTAGVLRLRATSAVSRDQSVRRSAQDDDSVGVLTTNMQDGLALMGPCPPDPSYGLRTFAIRKILHATSRGTRPVLFDFVASLKDHWLPTSSQPDSSTVPIGYVSA